MNCNEQALAFLHQFPANTPLANIPAWTCKQGWWDLGNRYFMAHQPAFMFGLLIVFAVGIPLIAVYDSYKLRKANRAPRGWQS